MIQRPHSVFLSGEKPTLQEIIRLLSTRFDYISVLGTDDRGISYSATPGETRTYEPMWVQRGFVFRAQKAGKIAEYACPVLGGRKPGRIRPGGGGRTRAPPRGA